jgi:hypothetical protein
MLGIPQGYQGITVSLSAIAIAVAVFWRQRTYRALATASTGAVLLVAAFFLMSLRWSENPVWGLSKVKGYALYGIVPFLLGVAMSSNAGCVGNLAWLLAVGAGVQIIYLRSMGTYDLAIGDQFGADITNPIWAGRTLSLGVLSLLYLMQERAAVGLRVLAVTAMPLLMAYTFLTGSRGPVLGLGCAIVAMYYLKLLRLRARELAVLMLFACTTLIALGVAARLGEGVLERMTLQRIRTDMETLDDRAEYWRAALDDYAGAPVRGKGIGSFRLTGQLFTVEGRDYPHNVILEAMAEGGTCGLLLVTVAVWRGFYLLLRCRNRLSYKGTYCVALWVLGLVNAQVSGDLTANQVLWFAAGLVSTAYTLGKTTVPGAAGVWAAGTVLPRSAGRPRSGLPSADGLGCRPVT